MKDYRVIRGMLEKEIEAVENRGKMDMSILALVGSVLDNIKDISIICAMQKEEQEEDESRTSFEMYEEGVMPVIHEEESKYHKMLEEAKSEEEKELIKKLMEIRK